MNGKGMFRSILAAVMIIFLVALIFISTAGNASGQSGAYSRYDQWFDDRDTPEVISDGIFIDQVDDRRSDIPAKHYYLIEVPDGNKLKISIEKLDNTSGVLFLETDYWLDDYYYNDDMMFLYLMEQGENKSDSWSNYKDEDILMLIEVQGVGQYRMTVDSSGDAGVDPEVYVGAFTIIFLVVIMLFSVLMSLIYPVTIIIVIVIIVISITKKDKKNKKVKGSGKKPVKDEKKENPPKKMKPERSSPKLLTKPPEKDP